MADLMVSFDFTPDPPWLPWQRNLGQNWLQLRLCKRYLRDFCVYRGVFGDGPLNAANRIFPDRPRCHANEIWNKIGYNSACHG